MRSSWTPALVPIDQPTVYLVADDFGPSGKAWREVDLETTTLRLSSRILWPVSTSARSRVVAFNTVEAWSADVSEDVAREIQHRCDMKLNDVPSHLQEFVDRYAAQDLRQFSLRLV